MSKNQKQPSNPTAESMESRSGELPAPLDALEVKGEDAENSRAAETATIPAAGQAGTDLGQVIRRLFEETEAVKGYKDFLSRILHGPNLRDYRYRLYQNKRDKYMIDDGSRWIKINNTSSSIVQGEDDTVCFGKETFILTFPYNAESGSVGRPRSLKVKVKDALSGYDPSEEPENRRIRWIHLPANNMSWVEVFTPRSIASTELTGMKSLMKALHQKEPQETSYDKVILRSKFWKGRQNGHDSKRHHARFMRPTAMELPPNKNEASTCVNTVFFMPYLHWETDIARLRMNYLISSVDQERKAPAPLTDDETLNLGQEETKIRTFFTDEEIPKLPCSVDEKLIRKYLHSPEPLHIRRTLDQSFYHTLMDTSIRDRDQVVLRYTRDNNLLSGNDSPPILMVDQCWIWVLGDTVISCFPGCWVEDDLREDPIDVLKSLVKRLELSYGQIRSPHNLASLIILHCSGNLIGRMLDKDEEHNNLHFLDWFHLSLKEITIKQTTLFEEFSSRSTNRQIALEKMIEAEDDYNNGKGRHPNYADWKKEVEELQGPTRKGLFDISEEIMELKSIKDIIDELNMIEDVVKQQKRALEMLEDLPNGGDIYGPSNLLKRLDRRRMNIKGLQEDAIQVYKSVLDLLDLKQKQANVSEARLARSQSEYAAKQAEETARQGVSIMLFTTVTIIFLPISTIASIFGLNAAELNNGNIGIGVVFAYLFPISLLVIIVSFLLAFHRAAQLFFALYIEIGFTKLDSIVGYSSFTDKKMREWDKRRYDLKVSRNRTNGSTASGLGTSMNALTTTPERAVEDYKDAKIVTVHPLSEGPPREKQSGTATSERPNAPSHLRSLLSWRTRNKVDDNGVDGLAATQSV